MRQLIKTTTAAFVIGGTFAIATPALAGPQTQDIVTTTIDQRDLATEYGVERVYKALARKAKVSCTTRGRVSIAVKRVEEQCVKDLLEDFIYDVSHESLTHYYETEIM